MKNKRIRLLLLALFVVAPAAYLTSCKANTDNLVQELTSNLREENFDGLYEQSSDLLHLNVSREQFVRRMKIAVTKLKAIDERLNFQRYREMETGLPDTDDSISIRAVRKLEKGDKSARVLIYWDSKAKSNNLVVLPEPGTSKEYEVLTILYKE